MTETIDIIDLADQSAAAYAAEVILMRALPDSRDGLKPVHRKIIYGMYELGLAPDKPHKKSARSVGDVMAKYHAHGDCLDANTRLYLQDGTTPTIAELYQLQKENPAKIFKGYAVDHAGRLVLADIHHVRIGQHADTTYKINLSDGQSVETTANHPFMMYDGSFVKAENLEVGAVLASADVQREPNAYPTMRLRNFSGRTLYHMFGMAKQALGSAGKNRVWHHADENKWNNDLSNFENLSRAEHAAHHSGESNLNALTAGRNTMFDDESPIRENIRRKNAALLKELNKHSQYYRAMTVVRDIIKDDRPLTNETFNEYRSSGNYYNVPYLSTLSKKGYIGNDINDISAFDPQFNSEAAKSFRKTEEVSDKSRETDEFNVRLNSLIRLYGLLMFERIEPTFENAIRYVDSHNMGPTVKPDEWSRIVSEFGPQSTISVTSIEVITYECSKPMYDFTVDDYENAMFLTGDDATSLICLHNSSIYGALVNMATPWDNNEILVDMHGNKGSIDGNEAAAMRYTEARLAQAGWDLCEGLDRNAVEMLPNFDGYELEPEVLPVSLPLALVNGTLGIGWSMATSIAPHNVRETLSAAIALSKKPEMTVKAFAKYLKAPDSPTGCEIIIDEDAWIESLEKGKGSYKMRAHVDVVKTKNEAELVITSIPYGVRTDKLKQAIAQVLLKTPALGAQDIIDESDDDLDIKIRVTFKKSMTQESLEKARDLLFRKTDLMKSFSFNNNMIHKGHPRVMGSMEYIGFFLEQRLSVLKRIWQFDADKLSGRIEILEGRLNIQDVTDEIIKLARKSESRDAFEKTLIADYELTERQAKDVASTQIHQLSNRNFEAMQKEYDTKVAEQQKLLSWVSNDELAHEQLIVDLEKTLGKFPDSKRRSAIVRPEALKPMKEISVEDMIESRPVKVVVKRNLELSQIGSQAFYNQIDNYEGDDIVGSVDATTTDYVMAITSDGNYVTRLINDLKRTDLSANVDRLNLEINELKADSEFVGATFVSKDKSDENHRLVVVTAKGRAKIIKPSKIRPNLNTRTYVKKLRPMIRLEEGDSIIFAKNMTVDELRSHTLDITVSDPGLKKGWTTKHLKLERVAEREDGAGGAGFRGVGLKDTQSISDFTVVEND